MTDPTGHAERCRDRFLRGLEQSGRIVAPGARVLDFGCGAGHLVDAFLAAGFDAYGCDIVLPKGAESDRLQASNRVRPIAPADYRIPFDDDAFDVVVSNQVFEHVQNYEVAIGEIARVLRPGGTTFHIFPSRYKMIEPHVFVPLSTVVRGYPWLLTWAALGIRNEFQSGLSASETARRNRDYLVSQTNYLPKTAIRRAFGRQFAHVAFSERHFIERGWLSLIERCSFGLVSVALSTFRTRVVMAEGPIGSVSIHGREALAADARSVACSAATSTTIAMRWLTA